jgi:hypothetical protein
MWPVLLLLALMNAAAARNRKTPEYAHSSGISLGLGWSDPLIELREQAQPSNGT